ncbi:MAG: hypothetical protein ACM3TN_08845 [Alphaproteobacteria bacterium]
MIPELFAGKGKFLPRIFFKTNKQPFFNSRILETFVVEEVICAYQTGWIPIAMRTAGRMRFFAGLNRATYCVAALQAQSRSRTLPVLGFSKPNQVIEIGREVVIRCTLSI